MQPGQVLDISNCAKAWKIAPTVRTVRLRTRRQPRSGTERKDPCGEPDDGHGGGQALDIHRIEFTGNTTTRDKVIRRELMVTGGRFNSDAGRTASAPESVGSLRSDPPRGCRHSAGYRPGRGQVDTTLHLKEKGRNTIGLTGGVSGLYGSFLGLNYSTNNFLGLGETLSVSTTTGSCNGRSPSASPSRTCSTGPSSWIQGSATASTTIRRSRHPWHCQNLTSYFQQIGGVMVEPAHYAQSSDGFTVGVRYPVKGKFTRPGLTDGYDNSNITTLTEAASILSNSTSFQSISGPNSLNGIRTSRTTPPLTINTVNSVYEPTGGKELDLSARSPVLVARQPVHPMLSYKYFDDASWKDTWGFRVMGSSWPDTRIDPADLRLFLIGGENDLRGFDIMAVTRSR